MPNPLTLLNRTGVVAGLLLAVASTCSAGDAITGQVGAGVSYGPYEPAGTRYDNKLFPYLDLTWGDVNLSSEDGLSWDAIKFNGWSIGPFVNLIDGRNANGSLRGLRDVPDMGEAGGFVEYSPSDFWRVFAEVGRAFGGGSGQGGVLGRLGGEIDYPLGNGIFGGTTLTARFADADQANTFYGVSSQQSAASGYRAYNASGGFQNLKLSQSVQFPLGPKWSLITSVSWIHLVGSAADSSIVRQEGRVNQGQADVAIAYRF